jgi:lipid-A-disaccharide synthase
MTSPLTVMLVAAEASGDQIGARLAEALRRRLGQGVRFVGVGGPRMAEAGVNSPFDISELSVLGLVEGLRIWRRVVRRADDAAALAAREKPDVAVLIDSWGFTLRVAHRLKRLYPQMPVIKYVGPQVWASRPGRAKTLARAVDHLLSIHAFDAPYFEREGLPVTFVGNSALIRDFSAADPARLRRGIGAGPDEPILLVLPGSRPSEVARMGQPFGEAVRLLVAERPQLRVVVPVAETVAGAVREWIAGLPGQVHPIEDEAGKADAMAAATVALACSGTVTTELALAGCPMVVGYRLSRVTHWLLGRLIRTPWVTLLNIAAQRFVVPELIQDRCTGPALAAQLALRLDDRAQRDAQAAEQSAAIALMGPRDGDPAERAADAVLKVLSDRAAA